MSLNRSKYLGASEVGAIMSGCDEYERTPLTIYLEKLGIKDKKESEIMQRGLDLEPTLFAHYIKEYGNEYGFEYQPTDFDNPYINPDYPWLGCHPDALSKDRLSILEIKLLSSEWVVSGQDPQEWLKENHPSKYWQAQAQLAILGANQVIIYPWVNNVHAWRALPAITITPNPDDIMAMITKTHDFWYNNIIANKIPEYEVEQPTELKSDYVETDEQLIQDIQDFAEMSKQIKDLTKALDNVKDKLKKEYCQKPYKSILAGQILLRASSKSGASRLSKDLCIAKGLDLTGCFERGKPIYSLEVARRIDE